MDTRKNKIRIGIDLKPELKKRLDEVIEYGMRNYVLEALIEKLVEKIEKDEIKL